ncbi:MAG TPA: hydrogenase maturation protease [Chloroflexia bacterium]|jgi:hydrogenase maturation protease|nr:hydrogenase maturation protease [Chloroflexia bacterium]
MNQGREPESVSLPLVIGVGNAYRGDDAAGLLIARRVAEAAPGAARVVEESGEGAALLEAWRDAPFVVLCDAVQSGAAPGTVHRLAPDRAPVPTGFFRYSTHAFSVAEAIELARALGELPPRMLVYGIEGADFAAGTALSPTVAGAVAAAVRAVVADLQTYNKE